jgi:hypothetical protein
MNTKTKSCVVRFVGGPSDGLVLSDPRFRPQDRLQMPTTPAFVRCGQHSCCELVGYWSMAYLLTSRERGVEHGRPTTCLRYDFLGYELMKAQPKRAPAQQDRPRRVAAVRTWFRAPARLTQLLPLMFRAVLRP